MTVVEQLRDRITERAVDRTRLAADLAVQDVQYVIAGSLHEQTGGLIDGIHHTEPAANGDRISCEIISDAPYSLFQDEGTGIWGPTGAFIFPTRAKFLKFEIDGQTIYARSVAGVPPRHFFTSTMPKRWADSLAAAAA